jgi:molecular chaperone GrpE (heat shock protein)
MNPLLPAIVQLSLQLAQLEAQNTELHRQLLEKSKEFDEYRKINEAPDTGGIGSSS